MKHFNRFIHILSRLWSIIGVIMIVPLMVIVFSVTYLFYGKQLARDLADGMFEGIK